MRRTLHNVLFVIMSALSMLCVISSGPRPAPDRPQPVPIAMRWLGEITDDPAFDMAGPRAKPVSIKLASSNASDSVPTMTELRPLFDAIRKVETGGEKDPANAKGDWDGKKYRALGPYQVWHAYWKDGTHRPTSNGDRKVMDGNYDDVRNAAYAERVMYSYWQRHGAAALKARDFKSLSRLHHGGPRGAKDPDTLDYWTKVRRHLN